MNIGKFSYSEIDTILGLRVSHLKGLSNTLNMLCTVLNQVHKTKYTTLGCVLFRPQSDHYLVHVKGKNGTRLGVQITGWTTAISFSWGSGWGETQPVRVAGSGFGETKYLECYL